MKRLTYLAAAASLLLASCSDEIRTDVVNPGQEVQVTFSASLPEQMLSRATNVSDGTTANRLNYTVFKGGAAISSGKVDNAFQATAMAETVSLPLITGETYSIVFWADNASSPYSYADGVVTIDDYDKVNANDENADAFFWAEKDYTVTGAAAKTVTLTRPFAQINFGTTKADYEAAVLSGLDVTESAVAIKTQTYKTLNLLDGSVDDATETDVVTYANFATPTDTANPFGLTDDNRAALTVEGTDYIYVGYAYVLTQPEDKAENITTVTLTPKSAAETVRTFTNVPVKRNYRTNIIGNLFTSSVDWTVLIDNAYNDPDENISVITFKGVGYKADYSAWDGVSAEAPYVNDEGDVIIASAAQLAGFAAQTNGSLARSSEGSTFKDEDIYLLLDVNLNNQEWTPIAAEAANAFSGYFHGLGHTISNLKVTQATQVYGLFGWSHNCSIEDLGIVNAEINSLNITSTTLGESDGYGNKNKTGSAAVLLAHEVGSQSVEYPGISNISVSNASIKAYHYAGGIVGCFQHWGAKTYIQNCNVTDLSITLEFEKTSDGWDNADKAGGIIGQSGALGSNGSDVNYLKIQNNTVNNLTIIGYRDLGGIIGGTNSNIHVLNNTVNNATISVTFGTEEQNYKEYTSPKNVGKICGSELSTMVISGNVANNVSVGVTLEATPETFGDIMKGLTTDAVITLAPGEYTFSGTTGGKSWGSTFKSWDFTEYATYEGMEVSVYENFYEGQNITLIGSGTDQTVFINSDGYKVNEVYTISAGGLGHQVMVNKANITFKNMLEIVRWYSIIDAKNETHEDCVIWGEIDPRSETVTYNNCQFYTTERTQTINGTEYFITSAYQGPIAYGMYCRTLNFNNCDFEANQNKAVQLYATHRPYVLIDVNATNCTLSGGAVQASSKANQRAFFEVHGDCSIHGNMNFTNCSINSADAGNWGGGLVYDGPWTTETGDYLFNVTIDGTLSHSATFVAPVDIVWTGEFK
ncbi:MAG: hypothetical protein LIP03_07100 [Bacteroidales bacterium]|nr:hypothetical protein [Bacteroidales bacterium]